jgi:hypothetical protein
MAMKEKRGTTTSTLSEARAALQPRLGFDEFLAKLASAKERTGAQQHVEAQRGTGGNPRAAALWERLVGTLLTLAPALPRFGGRKAAQFSIPDGKYKLQVFALQEGDAGELHVYIPDVRPEAEKAGLIKSTKGTAAAPAKSYIGGGPAEGLEVQDVTDAGGDSQQQRPAECVRPMLGWGKKALHVVVKPDASEDQIAAVEQLCAVAALRWKNDGKAK